MVHCVEAKSFALQNTRQQDIEGLVVEENLAPALGVGSGSELIHGIGNEHNAKREHVLFDATMRFGM